MSTPVVVRMRRTGARAGTWGQGHEQNTTKKVTPAHPQVQTSGSSPPRVQGTDLTDYNLLRGLSEHHFRGRVCRSLTAPFDQGVQTLSSVKSVGVLRSLSVFIFSVCSDPNVLSLLTNL